MFIVTNVSGYCRRNGVQVANAARLADAIHLMIRLVKGSGMSLFGTAGSFDLIGALEQRLALSICPIKFPSQKLNRLSKKLKFKTN